ncbi:Hypothetical predicted protein [Olea europaea subsp. europaea]|uniref:Uncharacterized protein n=1 Tax=Olea europaea subsp. europaea TaxID=158383 RepID=A0A8S0RBJ5_OLEEU|nr:Hypothetical predicted protein [Olea europaea subsp. europaea]
MSQIKGPENRAETTQKRTQVGPESGPETDPKWPKKQQPSSKPKESPKIKAQKYSSKRDESKLSSNYIKTKQSPDTGPIGPKTRPIIKKNRPKYVVNGSPTNHLKFYYQSGKTKQRRHLQGRELHRTGRKLAENVAVDLRQRSGVCCGMRRCHRAKSFDNEYCTLLKPSFNNVQCTLLKPSFGNVQEHVAETPFRQRAMHVAETYNETRFQQRALARCLN